MVVFKGVEYLNINYLKVYFPNTLLWEHSWGEIIKIIYFEFLFLFWIFIEGIYWKDFFFFFFSFIFISWRLITLQYCSVFVIHWHESAMDLHVFPIPIPSPTSLSTWSLWVFPVHQARALVSCIQPGLVICFTIDNTNVLKGSKWNKKNKNSK